MKYEFHVGDYVETKEGAIGYITSVLIAGDAWWKCVSDCNNYYQEGQEYGFMNNSPDIYFNRIGQYDFTKKDNGKIKPLCEEYTKSFPVCKTTTTNNDLEWHSIDISAVGKKIDELIEAVNRL